MFKPTRFEPYLNSCRRIVEHKRRCAPGLFTPITNDQIYAIECQVHKDMNLTAAPTREQAPEFTQRMIAGIREITGDFEVAKQGHTILGLS